MKKVFIINGKGGSGKDTFVDYIKDFNGGRVEKISSVDEIKQIAQTFFDWKGDKSLKSRRLLSDLKILQANYCDGPFKYMEFKVTISLNDVIFLFIREPSEIGRCKRRFDAETILIISNKDSINYGNFADDHAHDYDYDHVIDNTKSLKELKDKAEAFHKRYIL